MLVFFVCFLVLVKKTKKKQTLRTGLQLKSINNVELSELTIKTKSVDSPQVTLRSVVSLASISDLDAYDDHDDHFNHAGGNAAGVYNGVGLPDQTAIVASDSTAVNNGSVGNVAQTATVTATDDVTTGGDINTKATTNNGGNVTNDTKTNNNTDAIGGGVDSIPTDMVLTPQDKKDKDKNKVVDELNYDITKIAQPAPRKITMGKDDEKDYDSDSSSATDVDGKEGNRTEVEYSFSESSSQEGHALMNKTTTPKHTID